MTDLIESFRSAVEDLGVNVRETPTAFLMDQCPACGSSKYKVSLVYSTVETHGVLLGSCFAGGCGEGYSSIKYLAMLGMPMEEVRALHGLSHEVAIKNLDTDVPKDLFPANFAIAKDEGSTKPKEDIPAYAATLIEMGANPEHPVALYAKSRGLKPVHYPLVKIDPVADAVAFLVKNNQGEIVNFQKRYLRPPFKHMKSKNATGHDIHSQILVFDKAYSEVAIVEGTFTAISAHNYGYTAVCVFGSGVKYSQLDQVCAVLANKGLKRVFLGFDLDEAGRKGTDRMARYFALKGIEVWLLKPEEGSDLNDSWMAGKGFIKEKYEINPMIPSVCI